MYQDVTIYIPSYDNGEWHDHRHDIGKYGYETYEEAEKELASKGYSFKVTEWEHEEEINEYYKETVIDHPTIRAHSPFATIKTITLQDIKVTTLTGWSDNNETKPKEA